MKLRIVPYLKGSKSARDLASRLSELVGYKVWVGAFKAGRKNISWGAKVPSNSVWHLNDSTAVLVASDKLCTFNKLNNAEVSHVPYTASKEIAETWVNAGKTVFARTTGGQGGSGIHVVEGKGSVIPPMPLYTLYIPKRKEFRVHVFKGNVLFVQEKRRRQEASTPSKIRNLANGYVFCNNNIVEPTGLRELAIKAVSVLGLDFGAVDIIWNEKQNQCFVLEINTAPGLCPSSVEKYANAILG